VVIYTAHLGVTAYQQALRTQYAVHARCVKDGLNVLLLTEHLPVITLGYRRLRAQIRWPADRLAEQRIAIVDTERGGGATYHGPGQLVAYPIFSSLLRRYGVRQFVVQLEEVMCRVSGALGIAAVRRPGFPGVWVESRKLGAVGITIRRGVSLHGCALNVNLDLRPFSYIIPCGLAGTDMTSLQRETGTTLAMSEIATRMRQEFSSVFAATLQEAPDEWCSAE
jgi:lipoate-protein ligase B